jgi:hypothetical protein
MTTLYVPQPAPRRRTDAIHIGGVALLATMALPPIGLAFMVGIFALAYGEVGLLVLLASAGLATTLPAIVFAVAVNRARTAAQARAWLGGCAAVAAVPLAYVAATLG